jgi:hypothetical protein
VSQEKQPSQEAKKKEEAEKAKQKADANLKDKIRKTIVVTTKEAVRGQIEITITEGEKSKTLVLDHPVILESGSPDKEIILKIDGEDFVINKGERVSLVVRDGALRLRKESEHPALTEGAPVILNIQEISPEKVAVSEVPGAKVVKEVKVAAPYAAAAPVAVTAPVTVEVFEAGDKGKSYNIVYKPYPAAATAYVVEPIVVEALSRQEIRQRLEEIQEQLNRIKERKPEVREELKAVEESLKALSEQLEKASKKLGELRVARPYRPEAFTIVKTGGEGETKSEVVISAGPKKADTVGVYKDGEGFIDKAAYERAVANVKKVLPEGYTLESKLDEESGEVTLKIKAPEGRGETDGLLKKVLAVLKEELKRDPAAKKK